MFYIILSLFVIITGGDSEILQQRSNLDIFQRDPKILTDVTKLKQGFAYTDNPVEEFTPVYVKSNDISPAGKRVVDDICRSLGQLYRPVAVLIQDDDNVIRDAKTYLTHAINNIRNELWLMKFNATGVSNVLARISTIDDIVNAFKRDEGKNLVGHMENDGTAAFFSILNAARLLPPGGGVLVFADRKISDEDLAQLAVNELSAKKIRIFTVWQGLFPTLFGEDNLLREVTLLTNGKYFVGNTERKLSSLYYDLYFQQRDNAKTESIVAHETKLMGKKILHVPIDAGITKIHISLSTGVTSARFISPNGYLIDLLNVTDVGRFSRGSFVVKVGEIYEIQLNTAQNSPTPVVGMWRLETDADTAFALTYNITLAVQNSLILNSRIIDRQDKSKSKKLRVDLQGDFLRITNITLKNSFGTPIGYKLQYNLKQTAQNGEDDAEIETFNEKEVDINLDALPHEPVYLQVAGKDIGGNDFVRLSYFNPDGYNFRQEAMSVEMGLGSEMIIEPNRVSNVYFEVTNNKNHRVFVYFMCQDERRLLRRMHPLGAWLNPRQTTVVTLEVFSRTTGGSEYMDMLTFTTFGGNERAQKQATLRISNRREYDDESPHMWHKFTSDCLNVLFGRCEDSSWTIEVTAQDRETGLLQVTSSPRGLYFPRGYTSGTREEVRGYFSGSCCQPIIHLTAVDYSNNRRTYVADAYKTPLGAGAIAAIVLGVLLLIILIVVLICIFKCGKCKCCTRKESASVDLPTTSYRGPVNSASTSRY